MKQRKFLALLYFHFIELFSILFRNGDITIQTYDESFALIPVNHSCLFNSMIYPFTRMVIYGVIWYQGKQFLYFIMIRISFFFYSTVKVKEMVLLVQIIDMLVHSQK
jgi:hypothetical protein